MSNKDDGWVNLAHSWDEVPLTSCSECCGPDRAATGVLCHVLSAPTSLARWRLSLPGALVFGWGPGCLPMSDMPEHLIAKRKHSRVSKDTNNI